VRRSLRPAAAALGVLVMFALPSAALAAPPDLQCNGSYSGRYSSVTVPSNGNCTLTNATVLGDAVIQGGGQLTLAQSSNNKGSVNGNVFAAGGTTFNQSAGWTVGGTITAQGANTIDISGGTTHDVTSTASNYLYVFDATVYGSIVANQTQSFGEIAQNSAVTGNIVANGEPNGASGFQILEQTIGGSVYITNNQAPTDVFLNTITQDLVCTGNNPPTSDFGYGNYVQGNELGQCARLTSDPRDGSGS
jgi:hypothetical protein